MQNENVKRNFDFEEMERDDAKVYEIWVKANAQHAAKLIIELQKIEFKNDHKTKLQQVDYILINEGIDFCQSMMRDSASTNAVLDVLVKIYSRLLNGIVGTFCSIYQINEDLDDWECYAQTIFRRMITGDMPETIAVYAKQTTGRENRTIDMEVDISDKRVPSLPNKSRSAFDDCLRMLSEAGPKYDSLRMIAEPLFDYEMRHLPEMAAIRPGRMSINRFAHDFLSSQIAFRRDQPNKETEIEQLIEVRDSAVKLKWFVENNKAMLEKQYNVWKQTAYHDNRFQKERGMNFTSYISRFLPLALKDVFNSKAYKKASGGLLEKAIDDEDMIEDEDSGNIKASGNMATEIDTITQLEQNDPIGFSLAINKLTECQKNVFDLMRDGYEQFEIAKMLNVSQQRIYKQRKVIIKKLRRSLAD